MQDDLSKGLPRDPLPAGLAEDLNRIARAFAHDLRGPLHVISGYADLLNMERNGPLNVRQAQFVESIRLGVSQLDREIDRFQELLRDALVETRSEAEPAAKEAVHDPS